MIEWIYKPFHLLDANELYSILQLRSDVFVIEQNCIYRDADGKDQASYHLCGWDGNTLAAYARIIPPGISYKEASIGRVATHLQSRRTGAGKLLMDNAIKFTLQQFGVDTIRIGAQVYLLKFYEDLGFHPEGDIYLEDGIEHVEMLYK